MTEDEVIEILEQLVSAALNYESSFRDAFAKLEQVDKSLLIKIKNESPRVKEIFEEFETIYTRIQKEI